MNWAKDNLNLYKDFSETNQLIESVPDNGGVYFVPGLSGLFTPHWRTDTSGTFIGLTLHSKRAHIVRSIMEGICFRTREVLESMEKETGKSQGDLKVDGGLTANNLLL